jgi:hypothetical protein
MTIYKTMRGVDLDMSLLAKNNKNTIAVNPGGPVLNAEGKPIKKDDKLTSKIVTKKYDRVTIGKLNPKFSNKFKEKNVLADENREMNLQEENREENYEDIKKVKINARKNAEKLMRKIESLKEDH